MRRHLGVDGAVEGARLERRVPVRRYGCGRLGGLRELGRGAAQLLEQPQHARGVVVVLDRLRARHLPRAGGAAEQEAVQPAGRGARRRRPPRHDLRLRAGQGHVELAELLAVLLRAVRGAVGVPVRAGAGDVDRPGAAFVVVERDLDRARVVVVAERQVHHRVLQPLAAVHRDDLHGRGVRVQPPGPLGRARPAPLVAEPGQQGGQAERLGDAHLVQQLPQVADVGQQPLALGLSQHPAAQPALLGGLQQGGHAPVAEQERPAAQGVGVAGGQVLTPLVAARVEVGGGAAEERRESRGAHQARAVRGLQRLQQRQPLVGGGRLEHVAAGHHGRDAALGERVLHEPAVHPRRDEHGDVARHHRPPVPRRARGEQPGDVGGKIRRDVLPRGADLDRAAPDRGQPLAQHLPQPERRRVRRAGQPAVPTLGRHGVHHDLLVAERRVAQQHPQGLDQRRVGTPVAAQRRPGGGAPGGVEVGDDVAAAEGVDGLLGVADQHHRLRLRPVRPPAAPRRRPAPAPATAPGRCPGTRRPARPSSVRASARRRRHRRRQSPGPARRRAARAGRRTTGCRGAACAAPSRRAPRGRTRRVPSRRRRPGPRRRVRRAGPRRRRGRP